MDQHIKYNDVSETGVDIDIPLRKPIMKEKSHTNATNATLHSDRQTIWGLIWKPTVEESQTNAATVILPSLGHEIWGHIWKRTVEKDPTNAIDVSMNPQTQAIWALI